MSFQFTDGDGMAWMILPGLPEDHPANQRTDTTQQLTGVTFRASTGELRVLPFRDFAHRSTSEWAIAPFGAGPRVRASGAPDWRTLLARATPWPSV